MGVAALDLRLHHEQSGDQVMGDVGIGWFCNFVSCNQQIRTLPKSPSSQKSPGRHLLEPITRWPDPDSVWPDHPILPRTIRRTPFRIQLSRCRAAARLLVGPI